MIVQGIRLANGIIHFGKNGSYMVEIKGNILIDWVAAENANRLLVTFIDGTTLERGGNGLALAEDFGDEEEQADTFFVSTKNGPLALYFDEIYDVILLDDYCITNSDWWVHDRHGDRILKSNVPKEAKKSHDNYRKQIIIALGKASGIKKD